MGRQWMVLGFYICRKTDCPEYLCNFTDKILSVSDCLCIHEPQIFLCHGWKPNGDNKEYIKKCFKNKEQYIRMSNEINLLLNQGLFYTDGRFLCKKNAMYFYDEYFHGTDCILIAVCFDSKYINLICNDLDISKDVLADSKAERIGCDIIGWDISGFHSFLCNSFHEDFTDIRYTDYGLIAEEYRVAEEISYSIQGKGEPVDWIPVEIFSISKSDTLPL